MKKQFTFPALAFLLVTGSVYAQQTISVTVKTPPTKSGTIHAALCNKADDFLTQTFKEVTAKATPDGNTVLTFSGIPKGEYAVRLYQDVNGDGVANTGMFGMPKEPFGFSNNPSVSFGPPSFQKAKFAVGDAPVALVVRLINVN
ncbi:DUF2141 domain-containing protein [Spirosoma sp. 209]|uniref:DUF2141 domain-containing protein n=1 Tax=Spirosoma sp. 209 TaxID=1955701 RepID=UPI00098D4F9B|nr:DUF2141 domain-containing protein [Spirosoma sp. 209]